ncbi:hypothetical protein [Halorussus ruber]|uniref:hypothetical protein n=1 Tax=Halorussus ruber TaxID=1126238 RepID=UPI0010931028|nr:hypothetical protein [Halorussus ruber]
MADGEPACRDVADDESRKSDVAVLRSGREEARVVLNHQLDALSDLHTKAVRTVRITGVVLGLVLSAATLPGARRFANGFTLAGVGALAVTLLTGLVAYSASDPKVGIGPQYLSNIRTGNYGEEEWFDALVSGYENWIEEMEELNDGNARMLTVTQLCLGVAVMLLATGVLVELLI